MAGFGSFFRRSREEDARHPKEVRPAPKLLSAEQLAVEEEDMRFFVGSLEHFLKEMRDIQAKYPADRQDDLLEDAISIFYREVRSNPLFQKYSIIAVSATQAIRAGRLIPYPEINQATDKILPWVDVQLLLSLFGSTPPEKLR